MSSDSPTGGELSGLACRTLWSSTQESIVDEVSEFTGVILTSDIKKNKRVEGSVFGKCKASIILPLERANRGSPTHEPLLQSFK
jgi:hypothetical protein